jgi:hypothetical protein
MLPRAYRLQPLPLQARAQELRYSREHWTCKSSYRSCGNSLAEASDLLWERSDVMQLLNTSFR